MADQRERRRLGARAMALGVVVLTGCGGAIPSDGTGGASGDGQASGGTSSGGNAGSGAAGGAPVVDCDALPALGVTEAMVSTFALGQAAPAPVGGALVDGIYDLESYVIYGNASVDFSGFDLRQTIRLREGGQVLDIVRPGSLINSATVAPLAPGATALDLTGACPPEPWNRSLVEYSASAGELVLYTRGEGDVAALATHVRRP